MTVTRLLRRSVPLLMAAALTAGLATPARAVTLRDLVALSQAGLSDAVLIALIQTDQTIYGVTPRQILTLKADGVSDPVILALIRNGRQDGVPPAQPSVAPPAPEAPAASADRALPPGETGVAVVGDHPVAPAPAAAPVVVVPAPVFYPVAVPVYVGPPGSNSAPHRRFAPPRSVWRGASGFGTVAASRGILGGNTIVVNGLRIVTPRVVSVRVGGQRHH
ncbi:MAG: hypothetical protein KGN76_11795 [Acidobacteriota bacterium]|nr:hypothetical protein [Acidobacteriota bacterium]